jgi:hypothetical protein
VGRGLRRAQSSRSGITVKLSQGDCLVLIEHGLRRALPSRYLRLATCWDRLGTSVGAAHDGAREARLPLVDFNGRSGATRLSSPKSSPHQVYAPKIASRSLAFRYNPISCSVRLARTAHACPPGSPKESRTNTASSKFSAVVK